MNTVSVTWVLRMLTPELRTSFWKPSAAIPTWSSKKLFHNSILNQNSKACNSMKKSVKNCHFITLRNSVFPRRMQTTDDHKNGQNTYSPKVIVHVVCAEPCYYNNLILLYFYSEPNSVRPRSFWSPSYIYSLCVLCICHFLYFAAERTNIVFAWRHKQRMKKRAFLAILASLHKTSHLHGNSTDQLIMDMWCAISGDKQNWWINYCAVWGHRT